MSPPAAVVAAAPLVIIVEDDEGGVLDATSSFLESLGYAAMAFSSGTAALPVETARTSAPSRYRDVMVSSSSRSMSFRLRSEMRSI